MALTRTYPIDTLLQLEDGAGAHTSTFVGSGGILDMGSANLHAAAIITTSEVKISADDEEYKLEIQGSTDSSFAAGSSFILARLDLGPNQTNSATAGDVTTDSPAAGHYYVPFSNDFNGTTCRFIRIKTTMGGTSPQIKFVAHLTQARTMG